MSRLRSFDIACVEVPLRRPFATSRDREERRVSRIVRVVVATEDGVMGLGEGVAAPYVTGENHDSVMRDAAVGLQRLAGCDLRRMNQALTSLDAEALGPTARATIEMALFDAFCRLLGMTPWELFGGAVERVETDVTLSLTSDALAAAEELAQNGFRIFKVKVGRGDPRNDLEVLRQVRDIAPEAVFRLDANQAFRPDEALRLVEMALDAGIRVDLLEQPVSRDDLKGLDAVSRACPVPVYADEAVLSPQDALRVLEETSVAGINVKLMKSGVRGALDIAAICRAAGRELMMGCMLEGSHGIGFALALAAGSGRFRRYDLDSHLLLDEGGAEPPFCQNGPWLSVNRL